MEDLLHKIWMIAEFDYQTIEQKHAQVDVYNSLAWYLTTGRACYAWEKALKRADPKKLINFILKQDDQSVDAQVRNATRYLKRHCGYHC